MLSLAIDETGDMIINEKNNLQVIQGLDEVAQGIRLRLGVNKGEWVFNTRFGLDYDSLIQNNFDERLVKIKILEALRDDPLVLDVLTLEVDFNTVTRKLSIDTRIKVKDPQEDMRERILELTTVLN